MIKLNPVLVAAAVLMAATIACSSSAGVATPDPNVINTSVAQTYVAIQTQNTQPGIPVTGQDTPTSTSTFTPEPTFTPTATLSPTPIFTATPSVPLISVSVPTNCRVGPGLPYDRVGALLVGEVTEVYGRNPTGDYWYVRNPDPGVEFCWLWGEYASLVGNTFALPIFTPPPTPTPAPAFNASYSGREACNSSWWLDIKLENTGGISFRSISMTLVDTVTNTTVALSDDNFTNVNGCNSNDSIKALASGATAIVSSPSFGYDPVGHKIRASITLCSEDGVNGMCITETFNFTP